MKQNIAKVLTFSLLATSAVFISCVDNEKNLFDAEQLRQIFVVILEDFYNHFISKQF